MRNRLPVGLKRTPSGRGVGSPWAGLSANRIILTITEGLLGNALVTTAAAHGLLGGEFVSIVGESSDTYGAGPYEVGGDGLTATTFEVVTAYVADATGGVWTLA